MVATALEPANLALGSTYPTLNALVVGVPVVELPHQVGPPAQEQREAQRKHTPDLFFPLAGTFLIIAFSVVSSSQLFAFQDADLDAYFGLQGGGKSLEGSILKDGSLPQGAAQHDKGRAEFFGRRN